MSEPTGSPAPSSSDKSAATAVVAPSGVRRSSSRRSWPTFVGIVLGLGLLTLGVATVRSARAAREQQRVAQPTMLLAQATPVPEPELLLTPTAPQEGRDAFRPEGLLVVPPPEPVNPPGAVTPETPVPPVVPITTPVAPQPAFQPPAIRPVVPVDRPAPTPPPAKPQVPEVPKITIPPGPPSGQANKPPPTPAPQPPAPPVVPAKLALIGVVTGAQDVAVFESDGHAVRRTAGEVVAGARVLTVEPGRVQLELRSGEQRKTQWLPLREGSLVGGVRSGPVKTVVRPKEAESDE